MTAVPSVTTTTLGVAPKAWREAYKLVVRELVRDGVIKRESSLKRKMPKAWNDAMVSVMAELEPPQKPTRVFTPEEDNRRIAKLTKHREWRAKQKATETLEQREARLIKNRLHYARNKNNPDFKLKRRLYQHEHFSDEESRAKRIDYGRKYFQLHKDEAREKAKRNSANRSPEKVAQLKEYNARYHKENKARAFENHVAYHYGITVEERSRILALQGGHCGICSRKDSDIKGRRLHVDHCHKTERVRGLLCTRCNMAIGQMMDDPDRLRRAADYLERTRG